MVYRYFKHAYGIEDTFGTSVIDAAADSTYKLGEISQESSWPNPSWEMGYRPTGVGEYEVPEDENFKMYKERAGFFGIILQNGIPIWLAQGGSSTAGSDPYTHTITADDLPSITLHHERTGTSTDWAMQYLGCMVANLSLEISEEAPFLFGGMDWFSREAKDPNLDGTNAMLTNDPALPATANTDWYSFHNLTRTFDYGTSDVAIKGLKSLKINIDPGLKALVANWWDSGVSKRHIPRGFFPASRRKYRVEMDFHPSEIEDDIWDSMIDPTDLKDFFFKFERDTNDYISIHAKDCGITNYDTITPVNDVLMEPVVFEPRSLAIEVKDSIAGGSYGE